MLAPTLEPRFWGVTCDSSLDTTDSPLPLATILHMLTIKLYSTNYLLWRNQVLPLLAIQKLTGYIDGSILAPSHTIVTGTTTDPNPAYSSWVAADQCALVIIQSSLSEEAMAETLGHTSARGIWCALEAAYSHDSVERMHSLWDSLRHLKKGSSTVAEFTRKFKGRLLRPRPLFCDLVSQAKSHELFLQSINGSTVAKVAFNTTTPRASTTQQTDHSSSRGRGRHSYSNRGSSSRGRGRANLAQAFHAQCNVSDQSPDWVVDFGASTHMTSSSFNLDSASAYSGNEIVFFANGHTAPITHVGKTSITPHISLQDVIVNRLTKEPLARGRRKHGLYVMEQGQQAFLANISSRRSSASFELWHSRLGHVTYDIISLLNKLGWLSITSILPNPNACSSCYLSKNKRLSLDINLKHSLHVLDLVHCDLWGPSSVVSTDGFRYYAIFVDDYSRFTWFYPLKAKSDFFGVFEQFVCFVQTHFSCKLKVFQSDGGTEFTNDRVRTLLAKNGTFHRLSCPYTPQQNGRVERKHRHIIETGLAMMFKAYVPASFWTYAFTSATYIINQLPSKLLSNKSPYELVFLTTSNYVNF
nr:putative zinc finger, CCHC-type [Tanacetum cinerariifolium]